MRVGILAGLASGKIRTAVLLAVVSTAMVAPGRNVAVGQSGTGNPVGTPSFMAIDLNPRGFLRSGAFGISDGQQVGYGLGPTAQDLPPLLWHGSASSVVELQTPPGIESSQARGISGGQQVGWGYGPATGRAPIGFNNHALLWHGTEATVADLNPGGFTESWAQGISDGRQVGYGRSPATGGRVHALLWRGTAASVVDLHPRGFIDSGAEGVSGGQQVGWGTGPTTQGSHALLWRGTAASVVDLNPRGFVQSWAYGVSDDQQVGWGWGPATGGKDCPHAVLWRGTAASVVDLNPRSGFGCSEAHGTSAGWQVGVGYGLQTHALLWRGSADGVVDLHAFLPPGYVESHAYGIDPNGDIVGDAWPRGSYAHAVMWVPIKKPGHR